MINPASISQCDTPAKRIAAHQSSVEHRRDPATKRLRSASMIDERLQDAYARRGEAGSTDVANCGPMTLGSTKGFRVWPLGFQCPANACKVRGYSHQPCRGIS